MVGRIQTAYLINNRNFESFVNVVKVDAESGKSIPYAGAGFKIYDPQGNQVKMTFTYPTPTTIDVFYTDANGSLVTPEKLDYGKGYSMPSLGMITINAFACADSILIPVQAAYLPVKGLQQLIKTIGKVKRQINPNLEIEGILLTMVDSRTNYARDISAMLKEAYGSRVKIFENIIPISVRAAEISAEGVSIYKHDPKGKVASAYNSLTEEVLANEQ